MRARDVARRPAWAFALLVSISLVACAGVGADGGGDGGTASGGVRAIALTGHDERVTGIECSSPASCVVATDPVGDAGHVYAVDRTSVVRTLLTGDATLAQTFGTLGTISFLGFSRVGDRLVARTRGAESAFISATGDPTQSSSWSASVIGVASGAQFALNAQFAIQATAGRYVLVSNGRIFEATSAPSPSTTWTNLWSPGAMPSIPADIEQRRAADPSLCDTDPSVSILPNVLQPAYVSPGLELIVTPAGAVNQVGNDTPGVCVSTDGGTSFRHVAFANVDDGSGPVGIVCTSTSRCLAYGGLRNQPGSAYVFVTSDASSGASATWTRATTPVLGDEAELRGAFFAPDGSHGWIVGSTSAAVPLLLETGDGGATWTDATARIRAKAEGIRLHSGFALDATHFWVGGEHDLLLAVGN